jgi:hypothetical protein
MRDFATVAARLPSQHKHIESTARFMVHWWTQIKGLFRPIAAMNAASHGIPKQAENPKSNPRSWRPFAQPDTELVLQTLEAIASSPGCAANPKLGVLLRYVVSEEIAGRGDRLKAYSIAIDALHKKPSFDPATDSSVREEFRRLRSLLEHYFETAGKSHPAKFEIPVGRYRPTIRIADDKSYASREDNDGGD